MPPFSEQRRDVLRVQRHGDPVRLHRSVLEGIRFVTRASFAQNITLVVLSVTALFAPAFPLAPFLALVNNLFEIRVDAFNYCTVLRQAETMAFWPSLPTYD